MVSQWVEILYIPVEILNKMALWLTRQQNADGAFIETSEHFYDRSFLVNLTSCLLVLMLVYECQRTSKTSLPSAVRWWMKKG